MLHSLTPIEQRFVEELAEQGDPSLAGTILGLPPARTLELSLDSRIQSAVLDHIQSLGIRALDAVKARAVVRQLVERADNDGVRLRAAQLLWERSLGKVPDEIHIHHDVGGLSRAALYAEIRSLLSTVGLPPPIEGEFEEIEEAVASSEAKMRPASKQKALAQPSGGEYIPPIPTHLQ